MWAIYNDTAKVTPKKGSLFRKGISTRENGRNIQVKDLE